MKRLIPILLFSLVLISCKPKNGTLKGIVVCYTDYPKVSPDVGADLYIVNKKSFPLEKIKFIQDLIKYERRNHGYCKCQRFLSFDSCILDSLDIELKKGGISNKTYNH